MTKKVFHAICLVAAVVMLACIVLTMGVLHGYAAKQQQRQLRVVTELAARDVESSGAAFFENSDTEEDYRVTWVAADGTVLFDSEADTAGMENHLEREEVREALEQGRGESVRYSSTLLERQYYSAAKTADGSVVRVSVTGSSVFSMMLDMLEPIVIVALAAAVLALVMARRFAKSIVKPLNELDLDEPLSNTDYDELSKLMHRIDSQQKQIRWQSAELKRKRNELLTVTRSMNEGLVLLNDRAQILSINPAAMALLDTDEDCIGRDMLVVSRRPELAALIERALAGERAEKELLFEPGEYQVDASPVVDEGAVSGVVLLMFDVTEKQRAEQMRREFTANVSHELKTPLHSISGCAELMLNDMVRPEDVKAFTGQIYTEAQRMIRLVEDIIGLSQLDEGAQDMKRESVDLFAVAQETVQSLMPAAAQAGVRLELEGEAVQLTGIPQLLGGIVYNLCDNAIKYNREGGLVSIGIHRREDLAVLSVRDTGIGIPQEHQSRIFERFYRVDKSHSKAVGGTGLGLSIVKHAAMLHDARIELSSAPGQGTEVVVSFPL